MRKPCLPRMLKKHSTRFNPGSVGGRVMEVHSGMPLQPVPCCFVLVDVEIVENHVQISGGKGCDHILEEAQEVDRSAALFDVSYHFAACNLEGR